MCWGVLLLFGAARGANSDDVKSEIVPVSAVETLVARETLLTSDSFPGPKWIFFTGRQDAKLEDTWTIDRTEDVPVLVCRGEPHGYLRTATAYRDFEFGMEWKYPSDANGNSGVFMFTNGEDRIWPTSVQVQLHQPNTGSVFGSGGLKVQPELQAHNLSKPVNQWNTLVITSRQGAVQLKVNGKDVGEVTVTGQATGSIGLQSEGSEVHFRHIWIRDLHPVVQAADVGDTMSCCEPRCCPVDMNSAPFAPALGLNPTYLGAWGWNGGSAPPALAGSTFSWGNQYVANGIPLAGRRDVLRTGRHLALARGPAGDWEVVGGRRAVRAASRGRVRN
jgi:hypothetical protein